LRGDFAFAALTNGKVAIIDIDDFDAPCRIPLPDGLAHPELGCTTVIPATDSRGTQEVSCNIVMPFTPRSANYEADNEPSGYHVPGVVATPQLYTEPGTLVAPTDLTAPHMVAGLSDDPTAQLYDISMAQLYIGDVLTTYTSWSGAAASTATNTCTSFGLAVNLEDPRAQYQNQNWTVTYEGTLPGFSQDLVRIVTDSTKPNLGHVIDANSRFCDNGVLGEDAFAEMQQGGMLPAPIVGTPPNSSYLTPELLGDYVQVMTDLLDPLDPYWDPPRPAGLYDKCYEVFGTADVTPLNPTRDLLIQAAYNDHLDVVPRPLPAGSTAGTDAGASYNGTVRDMELFANCFPSKNTYAIRAGSQWVVWGDQTGFLHHVVPVDPQGWCRNACDPVFQRKNGRVLEVPAIAAIALPLSAAQAALFELVNPMFRFGIVQGGGLPATTCGATANATVTASTRDMQFRFSSTGAFVPMLMGLSYDPNALISPKAMTYLPPTRELAATDGNLNGLIFVSLTTAAWSRSFF
jgi:hypothetical protein